MSFLIIQFVAENQNNQRRDPLATSKIWEKSHHTEKTRRERPKSAPYLRLKKRKKNFFGKKHEFLKKNFFQKKSHSAEKNPKGGPFGHVRLCMFP